MNPHLFHLLRLPFKITELKTNFKFSFMPTKFILRHLKNRWISRIPLCHKDNILTFYY